MMAPTPPPRPGLQRVADETVGVYQTGLVPLIVVHGIVAAVGGVVAAVLAIALVVIGAMSMLTQRHTGTAWLTSLLGRLAVPFGIWLAVAVIAVALLSAVYSSSVVMVASQVARREPLDLDVILTQALRRTPAMALLRLGIWLRVAILGLAPVAVVLATHNVLLGLLVSLPVSLLIVYLDVGWSLAGPLVVLGPADPLSATGQSRQLVDGVWWTALVLYLTAWVGVSLLDGLIAQAHGLLGAGVAAVVTLVVSAVSLPAQTIIATVLYVTRTPGQHTPGFTGMTPAPAAPAPTATPPASFPPSPFPSPSSSASPYTPKAASPGAHGVPRGVYSKWSQGGNIVPSRPTFATSTASDQVDNSNPITAGFSEQSAP